MHEGVGAIAVHPLPHGAGVRVRVTRRGAVTTTPDEDAAWASRCALNPRLHDGAILAVCGLDAAAGAMDVAEDSFKRLVARADGSVRLLGVKAIIVGVDARAAEHVLIARRHPHTRCYGGLWELAPSGGVGPGVIDPASPECVREGDLLRHLAHEAAEELGIDLHGATDAGASPACALLVDGAARSVDVVFAVRWRGVINPRAAVCRAPDRDWEYIDTAWLARRDARSWVKANGQAVSPATMKLLTWMGWV